MPRSIVDDFLDGLLEYAREFAQERIDEAIPKPPREPRHKNIKPPKVKTPKTPKTPKPAKREAQQTHYQTLEVIEGASPETVSAAFRSLCQRNHPDKYPNDARARKHAEERTKAFTEAYAVLKDPQRRREYDRSIR